MKFSYNWLKELSGTKKSVDKIAELFMTHSFEVEGIEDLSEGLQNVVIGEVMTKEKHPDADRLNVATVNVGNEELQIVCGAPNLNVGQKVPVALVGANLKGEFKIKKSKIRGIESNGMICAEDELGIGTEHDGIMVLADDAPIGEAFAKYAGLDDMIMDIDILPNRGHDGLSYVGIANEIRALEDNVESHTIPNPLPEGEDELHVEISTN
ncbi:MAG TPA: phenylalanine--tRNA ligase subunit beta, partial [Candidatus Pacebacteria bacterium]|nr:phenylalanine--tRNA ligase subunit beta [Candidatus Paceibacterota bacterium]